MKKLIILCFVCAFSVLMLAGCQRDEGVQAGNDQGNNQGNTGTYQPRPAPATKGEVQQGQEITGELQRVDMAAKTVSVRVDNGMEQTFKFDDNTMVTGLEGQTQSNAPTKAGKTTNAMIRNLVGKEGSEVRVQWRDENGAKVATHVDVTQVSTSKSTRKAGKGKTKGTY
jgi:hypothetical protein